MKIINHWGTDYYVINLDNNNICYKGSYLNCFKFMVKNNKNE